MIVNEGGFDLVQSLLAYFRGRDDDTNTLIAGGIAGLSLAFQSAKVPCLESVFDDRINCLPVCSSDPENHCSLCMCSHV